MFTPFGTLASNQTAAWHPEPRERGTFSILSSCVTTLVLCVWTAVHLNIPKTGKEHLQKYRKAGWLVLGLLAPELVAWNAWEQYRKASRITQKVYQTYPRTPTSTWYRRGWQYLTQALSFRIPLDPVIDQVRASVNLSAISGSHITCVGDVLGIGFKSSTTTPLLDTHSRLLCRYGGLCNSSRESRPWSSRRNDDSCIRRSWLAIPPGQTA